MTKWEYLYVVIVYFSNMPHPRYENGQEVQGWEKMTLFDYSNWLGQQGWELVSDFANTLIFKRPLP